MTPCQVFDIHSFQLFFRSSTRTVDFDRFEIGTWIHIYIRFRQSTEIYCIIVFEQKFYEGMPNNKI